MRSSVEDRVFVPPLPVSLNELKQRITTAVASVDEDMLRCVWTELDYRIDICRGPGSSVGIATDYGLDGPGSNPGGDETFRPSRPTLGPTHPPVKWVQGLSRGLSAAGACC